MTLTSFAEYVAVREAGPDTHLCHPTLPLYEGDEGLQAFAISQNRSFKDFLRHLLTAKRITDSRLVQEAEALIADRSNSLFNYGEELLKIASAGRGRLAGADILQGATEAAGRVWELLWRPESYAQTQTWESRFPMSAQRGGIPGTVMAVANYVVGHYAQRMRKGRASVSTVQQSQIQNPDGPFDVAAGVKNQPGEWQEWRAALIKELENDLNRELAKNQGGKHWETRVRNLRWAIAIADKQMSVPYQWRSMPEVTAEIPGLQGVSRGGLQQSLKNLIDDARNRAVAKIGTEKEQAVAYSLQNRGRRAQGQARAEGHCVPCPRPIPPVAQPSYSPARHGGLALIPFSEYIAARSSGMSAR